MAVALPRTQFPAFSEFVRLSPDERGRILNAVRESSPTLNTERLSRQVATTAGLPFERTNRLIEMVLGMYAARLDRNLSAEDFARQICDFAASSPSRTLKPSDGNWEPIRDLLAAFLSLGEPLGLIAKALNVGSESERIFQDGRIVTDIRPIFRDNLEEGPRAAILVHTLRIQYYDADGSKEFYVALDALNVKKLKDTMERALLKDVNLRTVLRDAIPCLEGGE